MIGDERSHPQRATGRCAAHGRPLGAEAHHLRTLSSERYHPTFHRKAADSRERQIPFFERLIGGERMVALVHEEGQAIDGFIIGTLVEAPPVYDPGGLTCIVDDFMVARPEDWPTTGAALLGEVSSRAQARGAVQTVVVCGH